RLRVGFLGRLDPVKNLLPWISALWYSQREEIRVEGHIFGDGPDRKLGELAARRMGAQDLIFFHGATPTPQEALRQMDVLYSASSGEGFGLVLIEAMASGVPVVALALGGVTDIIENGVNGFLIRYETRWYRSLGPVIGELLSDPQRRQQII